MLAVEVRLLTGRYAAASHIANDEPEWPPHPARLFSAMTAAHHEAPSPSPDERAALEWLAQAGDPEIVASEAHLRHLGVVYVPVNDSKALRDVDRYIEDLAEAEGRAAAAAGEKAVAKADKALSKAEKKLRERSLATAAADGKGAPANAVELIERRPRQPRPFPVAIPTSDAIHFVWSDGPPNDLGKALDDLCARMTRLGHSSSLVAARVVDEVRTSGRQRWRPSPEGHEFIRTVFPNQLELLESAHKLHKQTEPRTLPARDTRYEVVDPGRPTPSPPPGSVFSPRSEEWIVYEVVPGPGEPRRHLVDISLGQHVARAMRGTILGALDGSAPESISGHLPDGAPSSSPHLAFVPLADVDHPHASGSVLGVALVPPADLPVPDRDRLLEAVFRAEAGGWSDDRGSGLRLTLGRHGVLHLRRVVGRSHLKTLMPERWCRPARRWRSVTAVALDRNPGDLHASESEERSLAYGEAENTVREACTNIGLPEPSAVWIHRRSLASGVPAARRFQPFPAKGSGPRRVCVHAEVHFDQPVMGPVMLGAGRFFGLGLFVPAWSRR